MGMGALISVGDVVSFDFGLFVVDEFKSGMTLVPSSLWRDSLSHRSMSFCPPLSMLTWEYKIVGKVGDLCEAGLKKLKTQWLSREL